MTRFLLFCLLLLTAGTGRPAWAQLGAAALPARPTPFRFVNDEAHLMSAADAKILESGLRRYADNNGTQIVVVTVPSLGGQPVAEYARALGTSWEIGQRAKNNGVVVLLSEQEHAVSIQAGSGLRSRITPAVTSQIISQMTPGFRQGNYFVGLKTGLNRLMYAADPSTAPRQSQPEAEPAASAPADAYSVPDEQPAPAPVVPTAAAPEPESTTGFGIGTLVLVVVVVGGGLWLVSKLFRRRSSPGSIPGTPDFLPNQPAQPNGPAGNYGRGGYGASQGPDFLPNRSGGSSGMGGVLLTGAAAAAGAYLGNRMADRHDDSTTPLSPDTPARPPQPRNEDAGSGGFPFLGGSEAATTPPDYFAPDNGANEPDYFAADDTPSSYDDSSSDDTGGAGFDDSSDNSGSW